MYNPFPLFDQKVLDDRIRAGKRYFLHQSFPRGFTEGIRAAFLVCGYDADEQEQAKEHLTMLNADGNALIYDAHDEGQLNKLRIAASQPEGYAIFYAGKRSSDWKPPMKFQDRIRRYIAKHHPAWRTKKGSSQIDIGLYHEFGSLFLKLSFKDEVEKIPFELIETP